MNLDCAELAGFLADSALDTDIAIDLMRLLDLTGNGTDRTLAGASRASDALGRIDLIAYELLALSRRALLVMDVRLVLLREIPKAGKDRVRRCLAKGTERADPHSMRDLLYLLDILRLALALRDLLKDIAEALAADTAWGALSAGLINGEVEIELGDVDDTVILVHDDHSARAHHRADLLESSEVDRGIEVLLRNDTA